MSKTWERLQKTLQEHGLEPKKSLGQNFLVNDQTIEKIVGAAKETAAEWLLEIGPGPGALTEGLRHLAPHFQVIELDRNWAQHWRDQGLKVIEADALQIQWSELLNEAPSTGIKSLVSNLPYQISSSLVIDRCLDEKPFDFMILMFQKEVAQRIRARLEDPLYGMLSVVAQSFWKIETLLDAGARDFFPPPKVASRVLIFRKLDSPVADRRRYLRFVKAAFVHPRKLMVSNLQEGFSIPREKSLLILNRMGLAEKVRAEQLTVKQFIDFYHQLI